jgi:RNA polymerase sigma factor (sigma-70 family)
MLFKYADKKIIDAIKSGDTVAQGKALKLLYESYYYLAINILKDRQGNQTDAKDIFQESIISLYENILDGKFKGESSIKTYLYSIIRNQWHVRRIKNRIIKTTEKKYWKLEAGNFEVTKEIDSNHIEIKEFVASTLLDQLNERCQQILKLYYFEKLSMKDITTRLNFSNEDSTRAQKYKCIQRLISFISKTPAVKNSIIEVI